MNPAHPIEILCDRHAIPILMFLNENGPCLKTAVYNGVSRSLSISDKLDGLEEAGLIVQDPSPNGMTVTISLSAFGEDVTERLFEIDRMLAEQ